MRPAVETTEAGPGIGVAIERLDVTAYEIPTDGPNGKEADGTLEWSSTTIVVVEAHAAGETGIGYTYSDASHAFVPRDFLNLLQTGAVDCLQADVTRCGGITGLLQVTGLSAAHAIDLSAHCAPAISAHAFCAVERLRHLEYFHDHVRVESMLFDGVLEPSHGVLAPDPSAPGLGLTLKARDAAGHTIYRGREAS